tara:strand:+ start:1997 stop:2590 length:594 start_codon:yes stop_codon:yes gene_type:complete
MKKITVLVLACFSFLSFFANNHINYVKVNTKSSTVKWKGSKITSSHEGGVSIKEGALAFNHGTLVGGNFIIDLNTITCTDILKESKNEYFVNHLKDEDFFDVKKFPEASLQITKVNKLSEVNKYEITGNLTIKGITNPITFISDIKINRNSFLATAKLKIDRTKWDIIYKSGNIFKDLGDKAILDEIEFDIYLLSGK